jgi:REP element-mobilizing transposase RayT
MGLQISRRIHPEMSKEDAVFGASPVLGEVFHKLACQKESKIEEGHLMPDHVHMMISIPPKYAVSQVIGFIKGKARSIWPGFTGSESATSWVSTSGRAGTS